MHDVVGSSRLTGLDFVCILSARDFHLVYWFWSALAGCARLVYVALPEQEALVGRVRVVEGVGGPEVAVVEDPALVGTGEVVLDVKVENVNDVVELSPAGVGTLLAIVDRGILRTWREEERGGKSRA